MAGIKIWNWLLLLDSSMSYQIYSMIWLSITKADFFNYGSHKRYFDHINQTRKKIKSEKIHQNSHFIVLLLFVHAQWYSVAVVLYFSLSIVVLTVVWNWAYNHKQIENAIYMHICNSSSILYSILIFLTISLLLYK